MFCLFPQLCIVDQCNVFELLEDMLGVLCMYLINLMMRYDWHCYDPKDWWAHGGRSFWCAGPYPTDRYQWTGTHGDMISSDLHGAEEPIRWLLGWQRQDSVVISLCTWRKKVSQGDLENQLVLWGIDKSQGERTTSMSQTKSQDEWDAIWSWVNPRQR